LFIAEQCQSSTRCSFYRFGPKLGLFKRWRLSYG